MPDCFIIMPITTHKNVYDTYNNDKDHFKHTLDSLFMPAVDKAGFTPKPPKVIGADLIQAEIIKKLEEAELVLCDISSLNPNVFYELGVRTALNKPVCYVKDEKTKNIPFDTGIINHHTYKSSLNGWDMNQEIEKLAEHIKESYKGSEGENTLWKYFGLKNIAIPAKNEGSEDDNKLDYIIQELGNFRKTALWPIKDKSTINEVLQSELAHKIFNIARENNIDIGGVSYQGNIVLIKLKSVDIPTLVRNKLFQLAQDWGLNTKFIY